MPQEPPASVNAWPAFDDAHALQRLQQPAPPLRRSDVRTMLADFALITYAVDPERLQRLLPSGFEAQRLVIDGRERSLISAVLFRDLNFRFEFAPWLRFHFGQTNYRAYVLRRGEPCVWFFGTSLATGWVLVPQLLWRLPWHFARMRFDTAWRDGRCRHYHLHTSAPWGRAVVELEGTDEPQGVLPGFASPEQTSWILTHPLDGYFRRSDGQVGSYSVWHERLSLRRGIAKRARFEVFEELGLLDATSRPHSVLLQEQTEFYVYLPPHIVKQP
ncbi:MAG: DUF2071 domain-containing protein [Myxococcales bacterium]|nr:DUF2071 domain-containing protein [Myxococcales bacterium]